MWRKGGVGGDPKKVPCRNPESLSAGTLTALFGLDFQWKANRGEKNDSLGGHSHPFPAGSGRQSRAKDSEAERMIGPLGGVGV